MIHLLPYETSPEEKDLLNNCQLTIKKFGISSSSYGFYFILSSERFVHFEILKTPIEKNFSRKLEIILRWFPGCCIKEIKIIDGGLKKEVA